MPCRLLEERDITLYCDLHGHSRKQNVFIYGCENRFDPLKRLRERVFPVMISKNAPTQVILDVKGNFYMLSSPLVDDTKTYNFNFGFESLKGK